jgi:hypothetical protein
MQNVLNGVMSLPVSHRVEPPQDTAQGASCVQKRLRAVFSQHLKVAIEWHTLELERAMDLLVRQDQANHWLASTGSLLRLDSARSLMLECRKQSENALTVLSQSGECVQLFTQALTTVLKVHPSRHRNLATVAILAVALFNCRVHCIELLGMSPRQYGNQGGFNAVAHLNCWVCFIGFVGYTSPEMRWLARPRYRSPS